MPSQELEFLYRALSAIKVYLDDFVIIGGFASLLYRFHDRAKPPALSPLMTYDLDIAAPGEIQVRDDAPLHELLLHTGFREELGSSFNPPLAKYSVTDGSRSLYTIEFHTPLSGSENTRAGTPDVAQLIQPKLSAQKLRYLDLLFAEPWPVTTETIPGLGESPSLIIKIPHPSMFIMQKILVSRKRKPSERRKDFAYLYLVLTTFRTELKSLGFEYQDLLKDSKLWQTWYSDYVRLAKEFFDDPNSIGPVEATTILAGVTSEMVWAVVKGFIDNLPEI